MYIKLSFTEKLVAIPQSWVGVVVTLTERPQLLSQMPKHVSTHRMENIKYQNQRTASRKLHSYDYYINCKNSDINAINKVITDFMLSFAKDFPAAIVTEDGPKNNPIINQLQLALLVAGIKTNKITALFTLFKNKPEQAVKLVARESLIFKLST